MSEKLERLTGRASNGWGYPLKVKNGEQEIDSRFPNTLKRIAECFTRLADYEDTGLTPEQLAGRTCSKKARSWGLKAGVERVKYERKLTFLRHVTAAARGGLELFRSIEADSKESFTLAQLRDYEIEVA